MRKATAAAISQVRRRQLSPAKAAIPPVTMKAPPTTHPSRIEPVAQRAA